MGSPIAVATADSAFVFVLAGDIDMPLWIGIMRTNSPSGASSAYWCVPTFFMAVISSFRALSALLSQWCTADI
jgi:hypothetical protein